MSRRTVLIGGTATATAIAVTTAVGSPARAGNLSPQAVTASDRVVYNLNLDWKFVQANTSGAQASSFDDSAWATVSVPHTFNDVDAFDEWITSSGEAHAARQIVWYRKHFHLPAAHANQKVLFECEGIRQAATVYVNGVKAGLYEGGVTPFGYDITSLLHFGGENVIAVQADNSSNYLEVSTGTVFEWDSRDFNPNYGGLTRDVRLVVVPKTHFTLPLYNGLATTGTYVYATNHDVATGSITLNIESQVRNEQSSARSITVKVNVRDDAGTTVATFSSPASSIAAGATSVIVFSSGTIKGLTFWQPGRPALYTVEVVLVDGGTVVDAYPIRTGFRKTAFRGGAGTGGVYLNDQQIYLSGYAQRATNEWALVGGAVPEWMRDHDAQLVVDSNANLIRWMHISAQPSSIRATDKHGIVSIQPAGDKEKDTTGVQWNQRVTTMRNSMIYFRNSPSILFWEVGNNYVTAAHMQQMKQLRLTWDPNGGRAIGCRSMSEDPAYGGQAADDAAEYIGTVLNRHYSVYTRDRKPIIECEYTRDEAPRRVWDDASPPDFGYKYGPDATYHWNSEEFAGSVAASTRGEFWAQRIMAPGGSTGQRYSGSAALCWSDSNQHGRQYGCETSRLSGRVDALRIPKESFYTYQVMQSAAPAIHVLGHWSYPAGTTKTMYVMAAHVAKVTLLVNGTSVGSSTTPVNDFLHSFPNVAWKSGTIAAVGYDSSGREVARHTLSTSGAAAALKLTAHTAPGGLRADGADVFWADVEAVDAQGRRVPTDQARVDFAVTGPAKLLGSYNEGIQYSVFKPYILTECGINRIFVRATRTAGPITLKVTRSGLTSATVTVTSSPFSLTGGLSTLMPDQYPVG